MTTQETAALLRTYDNVLILTHRRPDGDTIGCASALCIALRQLGRTAYLLYNRETTEHFLPYAQEFWAPEGFTPDHVVSVDIASLSLLPENAEAYRDRIELAIDHHPSFEHFAPQSCVIPERAACGEILYEIIEEMVSVNPEIALPLYVAVATDTGCFVYSNTTANTHRVAAELMDTGIDYRAVNKIHFRTKSRKRLAMEAHMADTMETYDEGRLVLMTIPLSLMEEIQATEGDAEDLSSLAGLVEGNDCAVTMREIKPDEWKISVRTGARVNATRVCQLMGGGGHKSAAGCTLSVPLEEAKRQVLEAYLTVSKQG